MQDRDQHQKQTDADVPNDTTVQALTALMVTQPVPGKHRAPTTAPPRIPAQSQPTHDMAPAAPAPAAKVVRLPLPTAAPRERVVPDTGQWKASHVPRTVAAVTLAVAAAGTAALGMRYWETRASDDFISLAIGLGVVVVLWAVVIASTPQVVSLEGSVLTVHNTRGSESFDLADGLQPVDVVGNARTSHWAVLLHRPNGTTLVLRRNDVDAAELDPIVRHYRMVAEQRVTERDSRFNR
jgi:hypothetical protein